MKIAKKGSKVLMLGLIAAVLSFGLVVGSCKSEYDISDEDLYDYSGPEHTATITLKSKSYKVEFNGHTAEGSCTKTKTKLLGIKWVTYEDGSKFDATTQDKNLTSVRYDGDTWGFSWSGYPGASKKAVDSDGNEVDVKLIIEDDEDDEE
ncbi:MAG: hypothetical protein Ta2F_12230 [Termitinemataceae bacterium]|nr:MAG: hypothetical protein Ta2F_12230 [Termitinemataceae bacterium]